jgi:LPS export ABC transporter protein LptC
LALNINIFFFTISIGLMMIYFLFKPMHIKQQKFVDVPLFELSSFTIYELGEKGLNNLILGTKATRYQDRYTITDMDYTDNSRDYIANMKANDGLYKNDIVDLNGDVVYTREDGLVFNTQTATYNKKTSVAYTNSNYVLHRGKDKIIGTSLRYNNLLNTISSKNVVAKYNF